MTKETDSIKAEIKGLHSLTGIDGLWDKIDEEIDRLYENLKPTTIEDKGAALAVFALGCRNPHNLDATDEPSQSPSECD